MNAKTLMSLIVAIGLGLAATWVGRNIILGNRALGVAAPDSIKVVVAKADIDPGRLLTASDLSMLEVPSASVSKAMFTDTKAVVGRAVLSPVVKGQMMFEGLLAPPGSEGGLPALVPAGRRAVSVEVTESSAVAGLLNPGCHVDVIATLRPEDGGQMARTIVENVKVQAVNRRLARDDKGEEAAIRTVTLIVLPKDAESIELASTSGRLRLVLRGATDSKPTGSPGVTYAELTGRVAAIAHNTPRPAAGSGKNGGIGQFLAGLMNVPSDGAADPEATDPAHPIRQAVRIIRGNSESTIYYELQPPKPGQSSDEWAVTSGVERPESKDPFAPAR